MKRDRTVLIVEDDEQLSHIFEMILSTYFFVEVFAAKTPALARIKNGPAAQGLLFDIMLPNNMGLSGITEIRELAPNLAIIATSGHDFDDVEVIRAGADHFIQKPYYLEVAKADGKQVWQNAGRLNSIMVQEIAKHEVREKLLSVTAPLAEARNILPSVSESLIESKRSIKELSKADPALGAKLREKENSNR